MTEEELPYGATMKSNKTSYAVPVTYDRRFVTEEQVIAVANYMAAIQNQDADLYAASALPDYTTYQVGQVYALENISELVSTLHDGIAAQTGEDFQFSMILVNDYSDDRESGGLEAMIDLMDNITNYDTPFSEQITGAWAFDLEWDICFDNGASYGTVDSQWVYVFVLDTVYYCCM